MQMRGAVSHALLQRPGAFRAKLSGMPMYMTTSNGCTAQPGQDYGNACCSRHLSTLTRGLDPADAAAVFTDQADVVCGRGSGGWLAGVKGAAVVDVRDEAIQGDARRQAG